MKPLLGFFLRALLPVFLVTAAVAQTSTISVERPHFDFGKVARGTLVVHTFTLVNHGDLPLEIDKVRLTPPLLPDQMPVLLPSHKETAVRIKLDTTKLAGPYEGVVLLSFNDPKIPSVHLTVTGAVILPLEVVPPVMVATAQRGEKAQVSVDIINHEVEPVVIAPPVYLPTHFTLRLEAVDPGRRYRLTMVLNPNGPAGKNEQTVLLNTNSKVVPQLKVDAFTYVHERVYTFPDAVDLGGGLRLGDIRRDPDLVKTTAQTLMVYRKGTSDFQATFSTDVPQLVITAERGPLGDRFQATIRLSPDKLEPGTIRGSIFIDTNDKEFPRLTVPVVGSIIGPAELSGLRK